MADCWGFGDARGRTVCAGTLSTMSVLLSVQPTTHTALIDLAKEYLTRLLEECVRG